MFNTPTLPNNLPPLRKEIKISYGGTDFNHTPTWIIFDPHSNKYYHIGWTEYQVLSRWHLSNPKAIIDSINKETTIKISEKDLSEFLLFLSQNCLLVSSSKTISNLAKMREQKTKKGPIAWLMQHYLFFRIPLVNPDKFLTKTLPYVKWLFTKKTFYVMLVLALLGLFFVGRQWDIFQSSFVHFFSWQGVVIFVIALIFTKIMHELGHAYMCKFNGLSVPNMGIAFMIMYPMLYTDTTESWLIASSKKRIWIALSGVIVEIYLAIIATWLWIFLPNGHMRNAAFFIAAVSWLTSILVNISPFLRFDGYHALSDYLGARNLQTRSFAITKWWIRNVLFGLNLPIPEPLGKKQQRIFIIYALCTWIYRLFLFMGIALVIYYRFFKALGALMALGVIVSLFTPVFREIVIWWKMRKLMKLNMNSSITLAIIIILLLLLFIPWHNALRIPATYSYQYARIFAPEASQINKVFIKRGDQVKQGETLITLHSPKIDFATAQVKLEINQLKNQLRAMSSDPRGLENRNVFLQRLIRTRTKLMGLKLQKEELNITAPFDGQVIVLAPSLRHAMWIKNQQLLVVLVNKKKPLIEGFVDVHDRDKIKVGQPGEFVPENINQPASKAKIRYIDKLPLQKLAIGDEALGKGFLQEAFYISTPAYHDATAGGKIAVRYNKQNQPIPEESQYRVILTPEKTQPLDQVERGVVFFSVKPESVISKLFRRISAIFVRESGF